MTVKKWTSNSYELWGLRKVILIKEKIVKSNLEKIKEILTRMGKLQVNLQSKSAVNSYAREINEAIDLTNNKKREE